MNKDKRYNRKNKHDSIWVEEVHLRNLKCHALAIGVTPPAPAPAPAILCRGFREGDKVFGLRRLQDAAWHTSSH